MEAVRLSREMREHGACGDAINVLSEALSNAASLDDEITLLRERALAYLSSGDARKGEVRVILLFQSASSFEVRVRLLFRGGGS